MELPPPWSLLFLSAELFFLILRSSDIKVLVKAASQRTPREQHRVERGLGRSVLLEATVFVPASAVLLLLVSPLILPSTVSEPRLRALYTLLGIASYGFPFALLKALVTRAALNTLKEFALLASPKAVDDE